MHGFIFQVIQMLFHRYTILLNNILQILKDFSTQIVNVVLEYSLRSHHPIFIYLPYQLGTGGQTLEAKPV